MLSMQGAKHLFDLHSCIHRNLSYARLALVHSYKVLPTLHNNFTAALNLCIHSDSDLMQLKAKELYVENPR